MKVNLYSIKTEDIAQTNNLARCIAIFMVVSCHFVSASDSFKAFARYSSAGKLGVNIFIFYSGFLIYKKYGNTRFNLRKWSMKRMLRIYPIYWTGLLLTILIGSFFNGMHYDFVNVMINILGVPVILKQQVVSSGFEPVFWFISLILFCYTLFVFLHKKNILAVSVIITFLVSFLFFLSFYANWPQSTQILTALPMFFWGSWFYKFTNNRGYLNISFGKVLVLTGLTIGCTAICYKLPGLLQASSLTKHMLLVLGSIILNAGTIFLVLLFVYVSQFINKINWFNNGINMIASLSFAIYCLHEPLLVILRSLCGYNLLAAVIVYFIIVIILSYILETTLSFITAKVKSLNMTEIINNP